jgi:hypothetical protein
MSKWSVAQSCFFPLYLPVNAANSNLWLEGPGYANDGSGLATLPVYINIKHQICLDSISD